MKKQINEPLSTSFIDSHVFLGRDEEDEVSLDDDSDPETPEEDPGLFPEILNIPENRLKNLPLKSFL